MVDPEFLGSIVFVERKFIGLLGKIFLRRYIYSNYYCENVCFDREFSRPVFFPLVLGCSREIERDNENMM